MVQSWLPGKEEAAAASAWMHSNSCVEKRDETGMVSFGQAKVCSINARHCLLGRRLPASSSFGKVASRCGSQSGVEAAARTVAWRLQLPSPPISRSQNCRSRRRWRRLDSHGPDTLGVSDTSLTLSDTLTLSQSLTLPQPWAHLHATRQPANSPTCHIPTHSSLALPHPRCHPQSRPLHRATPIGSAASPSFEHCKDLMV